MQTSPPYCHWGQFVLVEKGADQVLFFFYDLCIIVFFFLVSAVILRDENQHVQHGELDSCYCCPDSLRNRSVRTCPSQ